VDRLEVIELGNCSIELIADELPGDVCLQLVDSTFSPAR
jgi:hypothetical protein